MDKLKHLFDQNIKWAERSLKNDPGFFSTLVKQQNPDYLWIGCADSRVPANEIVDLLPGELFVHRNIANVVVHTDLNCLSVIQYAVDVLKVKHILVVGHYDCGGIKASLDNEEHGLIDNWLRHLKDVYRFHQEELDQLAGREQVNRLCELNVVEQVANVCNTTIVQSAWKRGQDLCVHGWVYSLSDGKIKDLDLTISSQDQLPEHQKFV